MEKEEILLRKTIDKKIIFVYNTNNKKYGGKEPMKNKNELNYKQLKMTCDPNMFKFETTDNLEPITSGIGQDRGIKALEFGINVNIKGYNIYLEGPSGVGKTMYTKNYLRKIAKKKKVPQDWCYIYNFNNPNEPIAVSLTAGHGK